MASKLPAYVRHLHWDKKDLTVKQHLPVNSTQKERIFQ